jgi:epsin
MESIEKLGSQLSQITFYDIKSVYNQVCSKDMVRTRSRAILTNSVIQAKNMVLNVSEMEAKVREATNDDPW